MMIWERAQHIVQIQAQSVLARIRMTLQLPHSNIVMVHFDYIQLLRYMRRVGVIVRTISVFQSATSFEIRNIAYISRRCSTPIGGVFPFNELVPGGQRDNSERV